MMESIVMMNHFFSTFVRSRLFAILFVILSFGLVGYMSMRLGKIVEIVFSLRIYVFLFISLCIYMIYMFIYEKSQKIYKNTSIICDL